MMVKGISKRVIVVRFPDTRVFEQAIFIVREDVASRPGVTANQIVEEARQVADGYIHRGKRKKVRLSPLLCTLIGAVATGIAWLLTILF